MRRRFYVAVVRGYVITPRTSRASGGPRHKPGMAAHVLDRLYLHRIMASYYSDTRGGARLGVDGALGKARTEARRLNAWNRAQ